MSEFKQYVCGLVFDPYYTKVVLIKKNRPEWQVGMWNAVGGKLEESDGCGEAAISREFEEETGVLINPDRWIEFATLTGNGYQIAWFTTTLKDTDLFKVSTVEDEEVGLFQLTELASMNLIPNVRWLIEMAKAGPNEPPTRYDILEFGVSK